jgi:hypothetical protein
MKATPQVPAAWDRITTREELSQIIDLLESIPAGRDSARTPTPELPMLLAANQGSVRSQDLWLDSTDESSTESSMESLVEIFADQSDLVN